MNKNQELLANETIWKLLIRYSLPAIIGMLVNGLYNVIDRIFIGNIPDVGYLAISGLGVTLPIMTVITAFGTLVGVGTATNISIRLGQNKKEEAEVLLGTALSLAVVCGVIVTTVGLTFLNPILSIFGASPETLPYAKEYITIIIMGSTFNVMAITMTSLIRSDGNPKLSAIIMGVGCLINILLDALFIFGFGMGIAGASTATFISQFITSAWALSYYFRGKSNLNFSKSNLKLQKSNVLTIFSIGSAPFTLQIVMSGAQVISNNSLATYGGDMAVGAFATIMSVIIMIGMPIMGLSQGAQPVIGFNYGAKQYDRANLAFKICIACTTIALVLAMICLQLFAEQIVRPFSGDNPELISLTADGLRKYTIVIPLLGCTILGSQYIQAIGKAKLAMILGLLRQVLLLIPLLLIMPPIFGLNGVWFAQPVADVGAFFLTMIAVVKEMKSQNDMVTNDHPYVL
ncbi:MAG: MATE family efflux transporter [Epulopiscium sp. Nele67-Bin004]|nr:MAG: MATE family efflux transporter [Epulopiscium sp. Nele67-Bin004]